MPEALPTLPDSDTLFEEFPCGLLVTTLRGTVLKSNETFCAWVGLTREELVGRKKLQELFTMGGRIFHQTHWVPMLQMQGSLTEVKFDVVRKDGRKLPMMLNALRRTGPTGGYDVVTMTMAEERNKYEQELLHARHRADELVRQERSAQRILNVAQSRLLQAVRIAALCLWDVDPATRRRRYGPEASLLLGLDHPGEVDHETFVAAIAPSDVEADAIAFALALKETERVHSWTHRILGADGQVRVVAVSGQAFLDEDGSLSQFVGVLSDITETSRQRIAAEDRALFAEQMVGIVSHDLRNPLAAIMASTQVLALGSDLPEFKAKALVRVVNSSERARRLIDELLDFTLARVGRGLSVSPRPVDLHALVSRIVDELIPAFPGRGLRLVSIGDGQCIADADRIAQLVGNLVGNAMTYGAVDTDVTVTSCLTNSTASIAVHNVGNPIPQNVIAAIFEPMVRGVEDQGASRSVGLGLFIVRAIAVAHQGTVSVESSADRGTTFKFEFPAALPGGHVSDEQGPGLEH